MLWGWPRAGVGTWGGFALCLRPIEMSEGEFKRTPLPPDRVEFPSPSVFLTIDGPKSGWAAGKRQVARADDALLCEFLLALRAWAAPDEYVLPGKDTWYRNKFRLLCEFFHLP